MASVLASPFHSGYLRFTRDYAGSAVKTPTEKYDISAEGAYSANGKKVIELVGKSVITESTELL